MSDLDRQVIARVVAQVMGECRFCGCKGDCNIGLGDECAWLTNSKTRCSNPRCIQQYEMERKIKRRKERRGKTGAAA